MRGSLKRYTLWIPLAVAALFAGARFVSIVSKAKPFIKTLEPIYKNPMASYEEKMDVKYPEYLEFINKVKRLTLEDSVIYLPNVGIPFGQTMWPVSNRNMNASLLYPRKVFGPEVKPEKIIDKETYIIFYKGVPDRIINAEKVFVVEDEIQIIKSDYDQSELKEKKGLIQL